MPPKTLVEAVLWLEEVFDRHGIERSYGGAFARNYYAPPRFTKDIKAILVANAGRLDLDRIRKWAGQLIDEAGLAELERLIADFYR